MVTVLALAVSGLAAWVPAPPTFNQRRWSEDNLREVLLALHGHEAAHERFPDDIRDPAGRPLLSWRVAVLPFLWNGRYAKLHAEFRLAEPWDSPHNRELLRKMPYPYCGGRNLHPLLGFVTAGDRHTAFKLVRGPGAVYAPGRPPLGLLDITDGTSNTVVLAEAGPPVPWTRPNDLSTGPPPPGPYIDAVTVGYADGSVRSLRRPVPPALWRLLVQATDDQLIPDAEVAAATAPRPPLSADERAALDKQNARLAAERDKLAADLEATARRLRALRPASDLIEADRLDKYISELNEILDRHGWLDR